MPHLPSIERWRTGKREHGYDPNALASRQEMRSFVCGQCHVEYYFKGKGKLVTYPWHNGLKADEIEAYYDEQDFTDWTHAETKAETLKAQHPEFETWSQGIHARSGVSCADCHMPYQREGAIKISDHDVRSPMTNINHACQTCHHYPEAEIQARVDVIQNRTKNLMDRAEDALIEMMDSIKAAQADGASDEDLAKARALHRKAQWRLDFCNAENSMGFHAPRKPRDCSANRSIMPGRRSCRQFCPRKVRPRANRVMRSRAQIQEIIHEHNRRPSHDKAAETRDRWRLSFSKSWTKRCFLKCRSSS